MTDTDKINVGPIPEPFATLTEAGVTIHEVGILPDGSGFAVGSTPLRRDHWIYGDGKGSGNPPMLARLGTDDPRRKQWQEAIEEAGRYAVKCATMCGKEDDFDPDALVRNITTGMLGYFTPDGLSDEDMFNPDPIPNSIFDAEVNFESLYRTVLYSAALTYRVIAVEASAQSKNHDEVVMRADLRTDIEVFSESIKNGGSLYALNRQLGSIQARLVATGLITDKEVRDWNFARFNSLDYPDVAKPEQAEAIVPAMTEGVEPLTENGTGDAASD